MIKPSDTERLDWLEENGSIAGAGLINDDNGHWAITMDGFQNVAVGDETVDISTTFFVERGKWCNSVRDAIDSVMKEKP